MKLKFGHFFISWKKVDLLLNVPIDSNTSKIGNWTDIKGAISKDYLPSPLPLVSLYDSRTRGYIWTTETTYNYRRMTSTRQYKGETSYSNEINLSAASYKDLIPTITVYPNPASSIINIQSNIINFLITNFSLSAINTNGLIINLNNYVIINENLINVDISNLPLGTYIMNFDTGDRRSKQITFIKSN